MEIDYETLQKRLGSVALASRINKQAKDHASHFFSKRFDRKKLSHSIYLLACKILRCPGLFRRGHRNALNVRVTQTELEFSNLPAAFDGFRILHVSDLHMDGMPKLLDVLTQLIEPLTYDLCVITGDFREGILGEYERPAQLATELRHSIKTQTLAILGNHDAIEMVAILEDGGIQLLLNEHQTIERNGEKLVILGVDDPHYYRADDLERALNGSPDDAFKILLAHSPEITEKALAAGVDLYLCGHTHAGQVCLPGRRPILTSSRGPKHCKDGLWEHNGVRGYTSGGAGSSSVPIRFNCQPEITIHTLKHKA